MTETKELPVVNSYEELAANGLKIKILLDAGRELTDADKAAVSNVIYDLRKKIATETYRLDKTIQAEAAQQRIDLIALFAGHTIFIEQAPNGYSPDDPYYSNFPWYIITTPLGRIKLGWRKRVIEINWEGSLIVDSAQELFPSEDVTRQDKHIHAWGYDKAQEYINVLMSQLPGF